MTTRRARLPLILGLVAALCAGAVGQCTSLPQDDGFDTGCCATVVPNLPVFPSKVMLAEYGALLGCGQTFVVAPYPIWFSQPAFITCDVALISVFAQLTPSETISGTLLAKYSRTWIDFSSPIMGQVWRFLVNGDLTCASTNPINMCTTVLPRCAALSIPVHFDGHIDYSCDPFSFGNITASFSLNHLQGCISHAPWSCTSLGGTAGHAEYSYHLVGPAPFTFMPNPHPQGLVVSESVRASYLRLAGGFAYQCLGEAKVPNVVGSGFLLSMPPHCGCGTLDQCTSMPINCLTPTANCYAEQLINGVVCCPGPTSPFAGLPISSTPIPNTGFLAQSIGTWGVSGQYPGTGQLTLYWGVLTYVDPCAVANYPFHVVVGVGVSNVFGQHFNTTLPGCGPSTMFGNTFIDLQNVLLLTSVFLPPGYGCLAATDVVWNLTL